MTLKQCANILTVVTFPLTYVIPKCKSLSVPSDANECEMFGSDICKNGQCSNLFSTYTCYCRSGFYYDNIRLECVGKKLHFFHSFFKIYIFTF